MTASGSRTYAYYCVEAEKGEPTQIVITAEYSGLFVPSDSFEFRITKAADAAVPREYSYLPSAPRILGKRRSGDSLVFVF
jgi:hypothetical protein